ncbi:MAG: hypothetical protein GOU99_02405 [Candidatus Altiarchaeota archaeon]|nr:hypothetical protein [Candidatus Altiarchaeota archaeon]
MNWSRLKSALSWLMAIGLLAGIAWLWYIGELLKYFNSLLNLPPMLLAVLAVAGLAAIAVIFGD